MPATPLWTARPSTTRQSESEGVRAHNGPYSFFPVLAAQERAQFADFWHASAWSSSAILCAEGDVMKPVALGSLVLFCACVAPSAIPSQMPAQWTSVRMVHSGGIM